MAVAIVGVWDIYIDNEMPHEDRAEFVMMDIDLEKCRTEGKSGERKYKQEVMHNS